VSDSSSLCRKTVSGVFWIYGSRYSGKLLVFLSTVILARLLLQEDFGVAGYGLTVVSFLEVLQGLGVGAALIYYKEQPERYHTAFWLGLIIGLLLFALAWLAAPLTGLYFNDDRAVAVTRVLAFTFPLTALGEVHDALLYKRLAFRRRFLPELARAAGKGVVAIVLALAGFGAWSLIYGQLAGVVAGVILFWLVIPWRPALRFDRTLARGLLHYGARLSTNDLIAAFLSNADYLLVGRYLGAAALGVYTLAFRVPELLIKEFSGAVGKSLFPVYTRLRKEPENLRQGFLSVMRYVNLITMPMGLGLALVAAPLVLTFFTGKWSDAIPVMQAIALYTVLRALVFNSGDVYKATGRPGLLAQINGVQLLLSLPALWWAAARLDSVVAVAWTQAGLALLAALVKLFIAGRVLQVSWRQMGTALRPSLLAGAGMALAVLAALYLAAGLPPWLQLAIGVAVGALAYLAIVSRLEPGLTAAALARVRDLRRRPLTPEVSEA
jgi:PST family polysaccharide transporter